MAEVAKELEAIYARLLGRPYLRQEVAPAEIVGSQEERLLLQGDSFAALGHYEKAVAIYEQVIRLDPMNNVAHANKGNALFMQGKYEAALVDQAIQIDQTFAPAHLLKAEILARRKNVSSG